MASGYWLIAKCKTQGFLGDVVQFWLERRPVTPEVAGSSPVVPAIFLVGMLSKVIILVIG